MTISKKTTKPKPNAETSLLQLLKKVLPKAAPDPVLAGRIYEAVEQELRAASRAAAFVKFCDRVELPDLEAKTLDDVRLQLAASFGGGGHRKASGCQVRLPLARAKTVILREIRKAL